LDLIEKSGTDLTKRSKFTWLFVNLEKVVGFQLVGWSNLIEFSPKLNGKFHRSLPIGSGDINLEIFGVNQRHKKYAQ
jgi:hypothetical protein